MSNLQQNNIQNEIEHICKEINLLQDRLAQVKIRKRLFEKGLKKIPKMQNLLQNKLNQMAEMCGQSRDELG